MDTENDTPPAHAGCGRCAPRGFSAGVEWFHLNQHIQTPLIQTSVQMDKGGRTPLH